MRKFFIIFFLLIMQVSVFAQNINTNNLKDIIINHNTQSTLQNDESIKKKENEYFDNIYFKTLYPRWITIKQNKIVPDDKFLKVEIEIDKNGNLLTARVINSINKEIDDIILNTLKETAPFEKFPKELNVDSIKNIYNFNLSKYLTNKIKNNVVPIIFLNNYEAIVKIVINKEGKVLSAEIVKTSNIDFIDKELITAILKIDNFSELLSKNEIDSIYLNIHNIIQKHGSSIFHVNVETEPIAWDSLIRQINQEGRKNWIPYHTTNSYKIKTLLVLNKEGKLIERKIIQTSGIKEADDAVLKSIDAGVYPRLPEEYKDNQIIIELTFEYKVLELKDYLKNRYKNKNNQIFIELTFVQDTSMRRWKS